MLLLRRRELQVQLLEARLALHAALHQRFGLGVDLAEFLVQLRAPRDGSLGLLSQAQQLDLQLMGTGLRLARLAPHHRQPLRRIGVDGLGADRLGARLVGDQRLRALLTLQVLDLLRARQQAGGLGVRRVETDRELAHRVTLAGHDEFAVAELGTLRQRVRDGLRGIDALEPVVH